MSSFSGIGSHLDQQPNHDQQQQQEQQLDYGLQYCLALHWFGCPNPCSSPDLCLYCHQAAQAINLAIHVPPRTGSQQQCYPRGLSQSWAHLPSQGVTTSSCNGRAISKTPATESRSLGQTSASSNQATTFTRNSGLPSLPEATYAQALRYPNRSATPYHVQPGTSTRPQQQAYYPGTSSQAAQVSLPTQTEEQEFHWRPARSPRPQSQFQRRSTRRSSFAHALARLSEENLVQTQTWNSIALQGPRIVMQDTGAGVGRLRLGIPLDEGYNSAIMSQGASSIRSTNSQRSERRKANALRVRNETFSFVCRFEDCGITFPDAAGLRRHEDRAHKAKDRRTYPCSYCDQKFHDPKDYRRHELTHSPVADRKSVNCRHPSCARTFTRLDNMSRHMRADHKVDSGIGMSQTSFSSNNSQL
ncbi:hypothetical protein DOTSEDRAFT_75854 [Dothistroma septosporum NZE10]|uniref:C2H2 type master regulator of conidiophore development brlA n=1 Tax=Dothistroma septosporum (strain NZE10 / CBS 128990) TaxID=675120 RepID=N1PBL5_DOTSN|nr:hypothetical protein DOTSEDRAFT_75854 [Dothistroma septosporum NZE10]